jgi:DNA invertase Pin-like site-specific DNA recombinase
MRVAIYAQVSTDKQDNGNQLIQPREFCERQAWEVVNEFCDTVSGSGKKDRVRFEEMMLAASQKQCRGFPAHRKAGAGAAPGCFRALE